MRNESLLFLSLHTLELGAVEGSQSMADCKYAGLDFCDVSKLNAFNYDFSRHHALQCESALPHTRLMPVCTASHHQRQPLMWSVDGTHDDRSVFTDWTTHVDMTNVLRQVSLIAAPSVNSISLYQHAFISFCW